MDEYLVVGPPPPEGEDRKFKVVAASSAQEALEISGIYDKHMRLNKPVKARYTIQGGKIWREEGTI